MTANDIIQIFILLVLVITALIAYKEIKETRKIHAETLQWNKLNKTQDFLDSLRAPSFAIPKLRKAFQEYKEIPGSKIPIDVILSEIKKDPEIYTQLAKLLNEHEGISRGIKLGLYDEEMVYLSRKTAMIQIYREYENYIQHRRKISNPNAWKNFEELITKWEIKIKTEANKA